MTAGASRPCRRWGRRRTTAVADAAATCARHRSRERSQVVPRRHPSADPFPWRLLLCIGVVLLAAAGAIVYLMLLRPQVQQVQQTVVQKIDLSGDVNLERMTCQACGAPLTKDAISLKEGAIMVTCPSCGTTYQIEEKAKY